MYTYCGFTLLYVNYTSKNLIKKKSTPQKILSWPRPSQRLHKLYFLRLRFSEFVIAAFLPTASRHGAPRGPRNRLFEAEHLACTLRAPQEGEGPGPALPTGSSGQRDQGPLTLVEETGGPACPRAAQAAERVCSHMEHGAA